MMPPNPLLGVLLHWSGGLCSASFYVPYKRIRGWSWEVFWLVGGIFSWVIAPWTFALLNSSKLLAVLGGASPATLFWCWLWGVLWGFGGLTFGLTMRYLGMSLGMAMVLGLTMVIGTLGPPIFHKTLFALLTSSGGWITFLGIALALTGVAIVARAGRAKEREGNASSVAEFDFRKGFLVALFSGIMSSCFAFGLDAGASIRAATLAAGTSALSQGLPVLCVVLAGGFTTNFVWCTILFVRNHTAAELLGGGEAGRPTSRPLMVNYAFAALGGTIWYFQFFFYTMGESQMGKYGFSSWTLHMASIIIFASLWGFALGEWKGSSRTTKHLVWLGMTTLVASTVVIGIGNLIAADH
jgi:L-rhamnose-H+ transport protein